MPRINLTGLPIAITGASSGIGAATAIACAEAGMPVALAARRADRLEAVVARITAASGRAIGVPTDVCSDDQCAAFIETAERALGPLYAVYANAGYGLEGPVHELSDADLRAIFDTNFFGSMRLVRAALPAMLRAGRGHILFCSSCLARMPLPFYGAYAATKACQLHLGRAMAYELAPRGIHVSTVLPVGTRTEFFDTVRDRLGGRPTVAHTPDAFMQPPERVARATVRCLRRPRAEVWTSLPVRIGMAICAAFPGIEGPVMRRMVREHAAKPAPSTAAAS